MKLTLCLAALCLLIKATKASEGKIAPVCAIRCWEYAKRFSPCERDNHSCLCNDKVYQNVVFQCIYGECATVVFGSAAELTLALCLSSNFDNLVSTAPLTHQYLLERELGTTAPVVLTSTSLEFPAQSSGGTIPSVGNANESSTSSFEHLVAGGYCRSATLAPALVPTTFQTSTAPMQTGSSVNMTNSAGGTNETGSNSARASSTNPTGNNSNATTSRVSPGSGTTPVGGSLSEISTRIESGLGVVPSGSGSKAGAMDSGIGATSSGSNSIGSNPTGTNPTGSNLAETNPTKTNPTGTNPTGSNPTGTNPTGSNPTGSNPTGTNPTGSNSSGNSPTGNNPSGSASRSIATNFSSDVNTNSTLSATGNQITSPVGHSNFANPTTGSGIGNWNETGTGSGMASSIFATGFVGSASGDSTGNSTGSENASGADRSAGLMPSGTGAGNTSKPAFGLSKATPSVLFVNTGISQVDPCLSGVMLITLTGAAYLTL